jgi:glycosyltransferase involved in cell wall biosynthesis
MSVAAGSGTYTGISTLGRALTARGVELALVTPTLRLPVFTAERLVFNRRLRPDARADITVGFDMDGYRLAGRGPGPHIASIKGVIADEMRFERGATHWTMRVQAACERRHVLAADLVLTTSLYSARRIRELYGEPRRMALVPEAIDLAAWERAFAQARPPERGAGPVVLTVCRFFPRKRVAVLLRAAARLRTSLPGLCVRIVGDGPEAASLRRLQAALGLGETVRLLGHVSAAQLAEEYAGADLFCLPSVQEGFGIVFLEAMAAGKPIVAARAAAAPAVVPHGELVEPDSDEALAAGILRLARDESARRRMSEAGLERVRQFDAGLVAEAFLHEARALTGGFLR